MTRPDRQAAERRGRRAEQLAALWLRVKGYRILARNLKRPQGEIDIIACRANIVAFVEVKYRHDLNTALQAVPDANWQRIARTASHWAASRPEFAQHMWRFDLMVLRPRRRPRHYPAFWRPKTG